jgi:hypothetical protein
MCCAERLRASEQGVAVEWTILFRQGGNVFGLTFVES